MGRDANKWLATTNPHSRPATGIPPCGTLKVGSNGRSLLPSTREAIETIIRAVPGFRPRWEAFSIKWANEETPWFLAMGDLASYVVESYERGDLAEFRDLFSAVETGLLSGDESLKELLAIGLFEDLQNVASHHTCGPSVFSQWLGERSLAVWDQVDAGMQRVAAWSASQAPQWWQFWRRRRTFDAGAALPAVENPELRRIVEQMFRKPNR